MSKWERIVESILKENRKEKLKDWLRQTTTPEYIYHIFHLDENLTEDKNETTNSLWLARTIYKKFLDKIKNKQYKKTEFGGIVNLEDLNLELEFNITGRKGDGFYNKDDNSITIYIDDIKRLKDDPILINALIHEITHSVSYDDLNNYANYIKPEENRQKYLTQPLELEANKVALCDYLIRRVKEELKGQLLAKEINDVDALRKRIDRILEEISLDLSHFYFDFLNALSQDEKIFQEIYFEVLTVCIEYIQNHLDESTFYGGINEARQIDFNTIPDYTYEQMIEKLRKNLSETSKNN